VSRTSLNHPETNKLRLRYRDKSEHAAIGFRDFRSSVSGLPAVSTFKNRRLSENVTNVSISYDRLNQKFKGVVLQPSLETENRGMSQQQLVKDIRHATTVKEVREIMSHVQSKYRKQSKVVESIRI